ncbi:hypothetical protein [Fluviicola sp.]|uniref:hypothetical protein n=1 Tax=Fluviicola sp. TaxID=1917219 RepID=UPI0031D61904
MKHLHTITFIGLGFMTIQSCSKQSEICQCTDIAVEAMKGERAHNYDGTFSKKFDEEHKAEKAMCEKLNDIKDKAVQEKMSKEVRECSGYEAYKEETIKSMEHLKKQMPELSKEIDQSIEELKAE